MELTICIADPRDPAVAALWARLDALHRSLYPATSNHLANPPDLASPDFFFLAAYDEAHPGEPLGVASFRRARGYVEIKRVFVEERSRGRGVARALVCRLEERARAEGYALARLETGTRQPRAVAFYRGIGYEERGPFGPYRDDGHSIFMVKRLAGSGG